MKAILFFCLVVLSACTTNSNSTSTTICDCIEENNRVMIETGNSDDHFENGMALRKLADSDCSVLLDSLQSTIQPLVTADLMAEGVFEMKQPVDMMRAYEKIASKHTNTIVKDCPHVKLYYKQLGKLAFEIGTKLEKEQTLDKH